MQSKKFQYVGKCHMKKHQIIDRYGKANVAIAIICICVFVLNSILVDDRALTQISSDKLTAYILNFLAGCEGKLGSIGSMSNTAVLSSGQWWRLFTHIYLHAGIIHLVFNILALLFAGRAVEKRIGSLRYALLFHLIAVVNAMIMCMVFPDSTSVGASAGIFGMIGILCVLKWKDDAVGEDLPNRGEFIYLIMFTLFSLVLGLESFVTHFAAFAFGVFAGGILLKCSKNKQ